tara:strand:- start:243 stop:512 length:270 start_codon:yes stop_codon:yes gene_type:complete
MSDNYEIKCYARLVGMMDNGSTKIVDHSEVVPPEVFWEQDRLGQLDRASLIEEINFMAEMVVEFASDIADEAVDQLTCQQKQIEAENDQ